MNNVQHPDTRELIISENLSNFFGRDYPSYEVNSDGPASNWRKGDIIDWCLQNGLIQPVYNQVGPLIISNAFEFDESDTPSWDDSKTEGTRHSNLHPGMITARQKLYNKEDFKSFLIVGKYVDSHSPASNWRKGDIMDWCLQKGLIQPGEQ
ncbi:hypothetical protein ACHWQZ_G000498 [Mnemiopsis leidyi]